MPVAERVVSFDLNGVHVQTLVSDEFIDNSHIFLPVIEEMADHYLVQVPGDLFSGPKQFLLPKAEVGMQWVYQIRDKNDRTS